MEGARRPATRTGVVSPGSSRRTAANGFGALPPGPYQFVSLAAGFAALGFLPFNWPKPRV